MPVSEAQKLANKRWRENNMDRWREIRNKAKRTYLANNPDAVERARQIAREYYWKNRERILEKSRKEYVQRNQPNELQDVYDSHCKSDDPITDSEDMNSIGSDISNLTDWETVDTTKPEPAPTPQPAAVPIVVKSFCHPLFRN